METQQVKSVSKLLERAVTEVRHERCSRSFPGQRRRAMTGPRMRERRLFPTEGPSVYASRCG